MTKIDATSYSITVRYGNFDGEICFEATVKELPDLAEYADSWHEAYELALDAIETTAAIFAEQGRVMPQPAPNVDDYSGRVTLRVPRTLHRSLARMAEEEGISLNQLMVSALAAFRGFCAGMTESDDEWRNVFDAGASGRTSVPVNNVVSISRRKTYGTQAAANW
ncbi:toxin-antitoxin system HicB family antitoxin [Gammaproteobacteria bacterium LSUCC0112]|nr:toxin-antitoxin system HicB family antitoxin [Gammaproteobacteria bacterium LSUCC0112]